MNNNKCINDLYPTHFELHVTYNDAEYCRMKSYFNLCDSCKAYKICTKKETMRGQTIAEPDYPPELLTIEEKALMLKTTIPNYKLTGGLAHA